MKKISIIALCIVVLAAVTLWTSDVMAYSTYSGGCSSCHGGFLTSPYTSLHDGQSWGSNMHDMHRSTMLSGDCNACHFGTSRTPVYTYQSNGGTGLAKLGCAGCHGRTQDAKSGAGLRQHHYVSGETVCAGCHTDANPANYKPVSENTAPPYYFTPDAAHPNKPTSSCNTAPGKENYAGSSVGLDNDGDGLYDAADPDCQAVVACIDNDKDGYGSNGVASCAKGAAVDCDDNNAAINPGAADNTCNGVDENCSGKADEGYVPASTVCGKGICAATGQLNCQSGTVVDTCVAGTPQTEGPAGSPTCSDSRDNDCDGTTDALDSNCVAACTPSAEVCDGKDNDCDGQIDEGITSTPTTCGVGSCSSSGTLSCTGGVMVDSCKAGTPTAEICDGKDNNCNGTVDDGIASTPTTCGVGICASTGQSTCQGGKMVSTCTAGAPQTEGPFGSPTCGDGLDNNCNGQSDATDPNCAQTCVPSAEVCDGVDNDCDGQIDEGITSTPTTCGVGSCSSTGTLSCTGGAMVDSCKAGTPAAEICDGKDNNCNGTTDDGIASMSTTCGLGICASTGQSTCQGGKMVDTCMAGTPQTEGPTGDATCGDSLDNDCDGKTDAADANCAVSVPGKCIDRDHDGYGSNGASSCRKGTAIDCNDRKASINPGATEVCDGRDNNCDGQKDEGVIKTFYKDYDKDGYGNPDVSKLVCRKPRGYVSNNGDCNDANRRINPGATEICGDNIDQNCNGNADDVCAVEIIDENDVEVEVDD